MDAVADAGLSVEAPLGPGAGVVFGSGSGGMTMVREQYEVLAIGNHVRAVEVSDQVLFSPDDRHEVEISGEEYLLLRERDIHAVAAKRIDANTGLYL